MMLEEEVEEKRTTKIQLRVKYLRKTLMYFFIK